MPKKYEKICCVCLSNYLSLNKLSLKDENKITLQTKLRTCISEIEWLNSYRICDSCTNILNIVNTFRETCLKSDLTRRQKLDEKNYKIDETIKKVTEETENVETEIVEGEEFKIERLELPHEDSFETSSDSQGDTPDHINFSDIDEKPDTKGYESEISESKPRRRKKRRNSQFPCEKCDSIFNVSIKLVEHCTKVHDMKVKEVRPFVCDRCPSKFCNSSNLLQHIKYHDRVRSNMCTYCGKGFITKTDLNIHEKQHLNRREYRCDECGKCFNTHKDIRSHKLVVHTDSSNWKYVCKVCYKPFPIKSNYDSHMRRHTGDKKFECHLCKRKFTDKCVLQRHMRTHSNVREYKCQHCDKEYKDHRVMRVHMAKIHGIGVGQIKLPSKERRYICHICPKAYYAKNKLQRHLYTHSGEKPYDCTICGKKFNDKSYVKQHLRKTHNLETAPLDEDVKIDMNGLT